MRAARQGAPHGFRYVDRLLDVDFAKWTFHIGPKYRSVYIAGWPASDGRPALLQWVCDIPNIVGAVIRTSSHTSYTYTDLTISRHTPLKSRRSVAKSAPSRAARSCISTR